MLHLTVDQGAINYQSSPLITQFAILDDQVLQFGEKGNDVGDGRDLVQRKSIVIQIEHIFRKVVEYVDWSCLQFSANTLVNRLDDILGDRGALISQNFQGILNFLN